MISEWGWLAFVCVCVCVVCCVRRKAHGVWAELKGHLSLRVFLKLGLMGYQRHWLKSQWRITRCAYATMWLLWCGYVVANWYFFQCLSTCCSWGKWWCSSWLPEVHGFVHNARGTYVCLIFGANWWVLIRYSKSVVAIKEIFPKIQDLQSMK
jgi:hypothetical protein